jgi:hypothetical protein
MHAPQSNAYLSKLIDVNFLQQAKVDKPIFARKIVEFIRGLNPPGRFLKQDPQTQLWYDIGNRKAMDKTRQALREGAPDLAKHIKEGSLKIDVVSKTSLEDASLQSNLPKN